jgi:uncharacterized protein (TIGR02118 family)
VAYKPYAYWSAPKPEDVAEFEQYYADTHVPRAAAVPNLVAITTTRTADGFEGAEPDHYRVAEMMFESVEAMVESAGSEAWGDDASLFRRHHRALRRRAPGRGRRVRGGDALGPAAVMGDVDRDRPE